MSLAAIIPVIGPDVAIDNQAAVFDGTTGKVIKDGGIVIDNGIELEINEEIEIGVTGGLGGALGCDSKIYSDGTDTTWRIESPSSTFPNPAWRANLQNPDMLFTTYDAMSVATYGYIPAIQFSPRAHDDFVSGLLGVGALSHYLFVVDVNGADDGNILIPQAGSQGGAPNLRLTYLSASDVCSISTTGSGGTNPELNIKAAGMLEIEGTSGQIIAIGDFTAGNYIETDETGVILFNGTSRITWTKIAANGVTLGGGPPTSPNTVADLQDAHDGNVYVATEIAGNAGQNLVVDFAAVDAFNWVKIYGRYQGTSQHSLTVQLEITPFDGSAWHNYEGIEDMVPATSGMSYSFFVPDDSAYINGGAVKVRFLHSKPGTAADIWVFYEVSLYQ